MDEPRHQKKPEPDVWPSQDAPNRSGPPFRDAPDDGQPFDPDATHQDLPLARRLQRR